LLWAKRRRKAHCKGPSLANRRGPYGLGGEGPWDTYQIKPLAVNFIIYLSLIFSASMKSTCSSLLHVFSLDYLPPADNTTDTHSCGLLLKRLIPKRPISDIISSFSVFPLISAHKSDILPCCRFPFRPPINPSIPSSPPLAGFLCHVQRTNLS